MNAQHTPGPWTIEVWDYPDAKPPRNDLNVVNDKMLLATVAWDEGLENPYTIETNEAKANARLIAAAPELLETLKAAENWLREYHTGAPLDNGIRCLSHQMQIAIAKATGK